MEEGVAWCLDLRQNLRTNIKQHKKLLIHMMTGCFTGAGG